MPLHQDQGGVPPVPRHERGVLQPVCHRAINRQPLQGLAAGDPQRGTPVGVHLHSGDQGGDPDVPLLAAVLLRRALHPRERGT
eukprot:1022868-Prorocentrum_minimum.AAC.1